MVKRNVSRQVGSRKGIEEVLLRHQEKPD